MRKWIVLVGWAALCATATLPVSAEEMRGVVVKRQANSLEVRDSSGQIYQFAIFDPKLVPASYGPGQSVKVTYQPVRIAVRGPGGQRTCRQSNRLESISPDKP